MTFKILLATAAFSFLNFSIACAQQALLEGTFRQADTDSVTISYFENLVDFKRVEKSALIGSDGHFKLSLNLDKPVVANFTAGDELLEVFLKPHQTLYMAIIPSEDLGLRVTYKGTAALENDLLTRLDLYYQDDEDFRQSRYSLACNENAFLKTISKKFLAQRQLQSKYRRQHPLDPDFTSWLEAELTYGEALQKLLYPEWRGAVARLSNPYDLSPNYYHFLSNLSLDNQTNIPNVTYYGYLDAYVRYQYLLNSKLTSQPDYFFQLYQLAKSHLPVNKQSTACGRLLLSSIKSGHLAASTEPMLSDYRQMKSAQAYLSGIMDAYNHYLAGARGSKAGSLELLTLNGTKTSLAEQNDQTVYLYFYSTSQGSARNEIPHSQELAKKFIGQPIRFVFVCIDNDAYVLSKQKALWQWPGVNTLTNADSASVLKAFGITSLPAAFIVDAKGLIFERNAPRPAQLQPLTEKLELILKVDELSAQSSKHKATF